MSSSPSSSSSSTRNPCVEVRRYAVVALTNLTFGNANIKSFLCSFQGFIPIMVGQVSILKNFFFFETDEET